MIEAWDRAATVILADAQLLASALAGDCRLWTLDRKLAAIAAELNVAH